MKNIAVRDETYARLEFAARVFDVDIAEVVARLVDSSSAQMNAPTDDSAPPAAQPDEIGIHVVYQGKRVTAVFYESTRQVRITSGPLNGNTYGSPSAAAIAVVEIANPGRTSPQTNGRLFWTIDSTNKPLRSIMGRR
ncbi:hypothetical protein [Actinoplanes sp. G11-F43]|uniref:hypothetical protein n=1 Tax=Actinoplanes sp. G11-F43 TaxID=3424130 RepID=UPI003D3470B0